MPNLARTGFALLFALSMATRGAAQGPSPEKVAFFESKIRPVLVEQCYSCHSADAEKNKKLRGGLRLDTAEALKRGGDTGAALVAGKPGESLLLSAMKFEADLKMPPKGKLSAEVIADFEKWIRDGAVDPRTGDAGPQVVKVDVAKGRERWAFRPLAEVPVPSPKTPAKHPIDRFLLAKLEPAGIAPNPAASPEKLLRRLSYGIVGLPPTAAEVEAFAKDASPDAYAKAVDRLLASPHYGERWARHWLDAARFAESSGYEFDKDRPGAYHYRDWIVRALNDDLPYDAFVKLQIAGDLLHPNDFWATAATGFLVAGPYPGQITAKTRELIRYNHLDDMVSTLGSAMLGMSLTCSRCHDHKYDPLPQVDYYRLVAALGRTDSAERKLEPTPEIYRKAKDAFDREMTPLLKARDDYERTTLPGRIDEWHARNRDLPAPRWLTAIAKEAKGTKGPLRRLGEGAYAGPPKIGKDTYTFVVESQLPKLTAIRIETTEDDAFRLAEVRVTAGPTAGKAKAAPVKLKAGATTAKARDLAPTLDGDAKTAWAPEPGKQLATYTFDAPVGSEAGTTFVITLAYDQVPKGVRVSLTTEPNAAPDGPTGPQAEGELRALLAKAKRPPIAELGRWLRLFDPETNQVYLAVDDLKRKEPQPDTLPVFVASSGKGGEVHHLIRGEVERKNGVAAPGFLQVLMPTAKDAEKRWTEKVDPRVALANWLVDAEAGAGNLLARVIVNRLWQHHMGRGLVPTTNDFGAQGDAATHPELLDWLARELIRGGWKLRPIHRLIVTSNAYRRTGEVRPEAMKADPRNTLWWRSPPRRLEAEAIRDAVLAATGTLDPRLAGPGSSDAEASSRRSLYLTQKRSRMPSLMQMFDAPDPIQSVGERSVTTVPAQSLAFLNSNFVRSRAEKLAASIKPKSDGEAESAVRSAFLATFGRGPSEAETARVLAFVQSQSAAYGPTGRDRAWTDACHALLCANEFVYVD